MKKKNIIGENIHRHRTAAGLTQEELALRSGLSQGYINQVEHGKRKFTQKSLELISKALSIPMVELFKEDEPLQAPLVREEEVQYGRKPINIEEFSSLLKQLPPHIIEHYLTLLKMEIDLRKNQKNPPR